MQTKPRFIASAQRSRSSFLTTFSVQPADEIRCRGYGAHARSPGSRPALAVRFRHGNLPLVAARCHTFRHEPSSGSSTARHSAQGRREKRDARGSLHTAVINLCWPDPERCHLAPAADSCGVLAVVANPEWITLDYQEAVKAIQASIRRVIALFKSIAGTKERGPGPRFGSRQDRTTVADKLALARKSSAGKSVDAIVYCRAGAKLRGYPAARWR